MTDRPDPPAGEPPAGEAPPPRPAERARRPYAVVVENERAGRSPGTSVAPPSRFEITARETIVGRDPSCAIRLDNLFVSRRHARLLLRGATLHLDDLASTNVTRRNGDPVYTRVQVHPGDVLHFASVRCRVVEASPHPDDEAAEDRPVEAAESAEAGSAPPEAGAAPVGTAEAASGPHPAEPPTAAPASGDEDGEGEGERGGVEEPGAPAPAAEAAPARPTPAPAGDDGPSGESGEGEGAPGEGGSAGGEEPALEARPAPEDAPAGPGIPAAPVTPAAPVSPAAPVAPVAPAVRTGPIFVAGPLPGEPRRTRLRAALWGLALAALAALAAVVLL